ncbi:hypothetical protein GCM10027347_56060 [Larkinella harenae]
MGNQLGNDDTKRITGRHMKAVLLADAELWDSRGKNRKKKRQPTVFLPLRLTLWTPSFKEEQEIFHDVYL